MADGGGKNDAHMTIRNETGPVAAVDAGNTHIRVVVRENGAIAVGAGEVEQLRAGEAHCALLPGTDRVGQLLVAPLIHDGQAVTVRAGEGRSASAGP